MFYWRSIVRPSDEREPVVEVGFTRRGSHAPDRSAARSRRPFGALNLGGHVGDDPASVEGNRAALAGELGISRDRLVFMRQVHGSSVQEVSSAWQGEVPEADAIITTTTDLVLAVLVADCVPVLLHDRARGVVAAVHAGRPGMIAGVVPQAVQRMRALGARDIDAVVGPSVCGRCYEVPAEMVSAAAAVSPASVARSWTGTPAIDVAAGVVEQLAGEGVAVQWVPGCTREDDDLYSYRRDHQTGRFAGVVVLRSGRGPQ